MTEKGFESFLEKYEDEIQLSAERAGISVEAFKDKLRVIYVVVEEFVDTVWRIIKEFLTNIDFEKMERKIGQRLHLYKLDLKRPIIKNQVIDRKPQHLIKKIIY
ncbi:MULTISPECIES: hypothetical protein [unclassified Lysinibacillus]|uniref:hypothetical protein n=1 Tax=unclassified Lysinibacillus TaxID=2636778 RepID=UPI0038276A33